MRQYVYFMAESGKTYRLYRKYFKQKLHRIEFATKKFNGRISLSTPAVELGAPKIYVFEIS